MTHCPTTTAHRTLHTSHSRHLPLPTAALALACLAAPVLAQGIRAKFEAEQAMQVRVSDGKSNVTKTLPRGTDLTFKPHSLHVQRGANLAHLSAWLTNRQNRSIEATVVAVVDSSFTNQTHGRALASAGPAQTLLTLSAPAPVQVRLRVSWFATAQSAYASGPRSFGIVDIGANGKRDFVGDHTGDKSQEFNLVIPPTGIKIRMRTQSYGIATTGRRRQDFGGVLRLRVVPAQRGSLSRYGTSCGDLRMTAFAGLGTLDFEVSQARNQYTVLVIGSRRFQQGLPLPSGCHLWTDPAVMVHLHPDMQGRARYMVTLPRLRSWHAHCQAVSYDNSSFEASAAMTIRYR